MWDLNQVEQRALIFSPPNIINRVKRCYSHPNLGRMIYFKTCEGKNEPLVCLILVLEIHHNGYYFYMSRLKMIIIQFL